MQCRVWSSGAHLGKGVPQPLGIKAPVQVLAHHPGLKGREQQGRGDAACTHMRVQEGAFTDAGASAQHAAELVGHLHRHNASTALLRMDNLPACPSACVLVYLSRSQPITSTRGSRQVCVPACLPACQSTSLPARAPGQAHVCLPAQDLVHHLPRMRPTMRTQ